MTVYTRGQAGFSGKKNGKPAPRIRKATKSKTFPDRGRKSAEADLSCFISHYSTSGAAESGSSCGRE